MPELDDRYSRVITIANEKGGVLKTTLVSNIAGLLASPDSRVLIVDMDPQGNVAHDLGYSGTEDDDKGKNLAFGLMGMEEATPLKNVRPGLDVIVGGGMLHRATPWLGQNPGPAQIALRTFLDPIIDDYELVMIDIPPGDRALRFAALGTSKFVIAPTKSDRSSAAGVREVILQMNEIGQEGGVNESIDLLGVILVDTVPNATLIKRTARRTLLQELELHEDDEQNAPQIFTSTLRHLEKAAQISRDRGKLFTELEEDAKEQPEWWKFRRGDASSDNAVPNSAGTAAEDIRRIAQEMINRILESEGVGEDNE